jgi:hypothetical protein
VGMSRMKRRKLAALGLAVTSLAVVAPAVSASAYTFGAGQHLEVLYNNSPLRSCNADFCLVMLWMPATTSMGPGGGWVTSEQNQSASNPYCLINYRGTIGWARLLATRSTGNHRLAEARPARLRRGGTIGHVSPPPTALRRWGDGQRER